MVRFSKSQLIWSTATWISLIGFLLSPFLILLFYFPQLSWPEFSEFWWAGKNTVVQAFWSSVVSIFFGFFCALGLLRLAPNSVMRKLFELACLAFSFLPPLFVIVFVLDITELFPMGILGIVIVHSFINTGLVAFIIARQIESQFSNQISLAFIEGASRGQLLRALRTPLAGMLLRLGFFVFVVCVSSFTVPLMVGGGRGTTLEVLVYEKIRISGDFSVALGLTLVQGLFVFAISYMLPSVSVNTRIGDRKIHLLPSTFFMALLSLTVLTGVGFFSAEVIEGWGRIEMIPGLDDLILEYIPFTLGLGLCVGIVTTVIFAVQASIFSNNIIHRWVGGIVSLSPALVGFSYLLAFGEGQSWSLILCLACLFYPTLYRLGGESALQTLQKQQEIAYLLGANRYQILRSITFPQAISQIAKMATLASIWGMGDFAISKILIAKEVSLGMLAANLTSSYRIQGAFAICGIILVLVSIPFLFFQGMACVYRQASR